VGVCIFLSLSFGPYAFLLVEIFVFSFGFARYCFPACYFFLSFFLWSPVRGYSFDFLFFFLKKKGCMYIPHGSAAVFVFSAHSLGPYMHLYLYLCLSIHREAM